MSAQESSRVDVPRHKLLPNVRKLMMEEFTFKHTTKNCGYSVIDDHLGQEPYNMLTNRDGERYASTTWKVSLEQLWAMNNIVPDAKERRHFEDSLKYEGQNFSRREIYQEPHFRADLIKHLRDQFSAMGYPRVYTDTITRTDRRSSITYTTFLIKVKVV